MDIRPFCGSGFLDGFWRPPSEDYSPNDNFRGCRFGIGMHRSMGSPEPSGGAQGVRWIRLDERAMFAHSILMTDGENRKNWARA